MNCSASSSAARIGSIRSREFRAGFGQADRARGPVQKQGADFLFERGNDARYRRLGHVQVAAGGGKIAAPGNPDKQLQGGEVVIHGGGEFQ
jgi:hypothetical protein